MAGELEGSGCALKLGGSGARRLALRAVAFMLKRLVSFPLKFCCGTSLRAGTFGCFAKPSSPLNHNIQLRSPEAFRENLIGPRAFGRLKAFPPKRFGAIDRTIGVFGEDIF